jgi:RHS repeat-associated protein
MNWLKVIIRVMPIVALMLIGVAVHISAQAPTGGSLTYSETVLGELNNTASTPHSWTFTASDRELFSVRVQRIGGQFSPTLEVLNPSGEPLTPTQTLMQDADRIWFLFMDGAVSGEYSIRVTGTASDSIENPNQYSLSLLYEGIRRADVDEGLEPLPRRNADDMPNLQDGTAHSTELEIPFYGNATLTQPDARTQRNRWILSGGGFSIDIDNTNPLSRGLQSLSISAEGVGFTMLDGAAFFSDESISAITFSQSITEVTLTDGRSIRTDFYRIRQIQAAEGLLIVTTPNNQRMIFTGTTFDFTRRGGINGEGPNAEPVNLFNVNDNELSTDLSGWHTLYYDTASRPEMRILYGADTRFISAYLNADVHQRGNQEKPELTPELDTRYLDVILHEPDTRNPKSYTFEIDPFGMGDVIVTPDSLNIRPLDGRDITETTSNVQSILLEQRGVRIIRTDATYRLSLPDGTDIETPSAVPANRDTVPNDVAYRPSNANNLGTHLYDFHPQLTWDEYLLPVNPVNGNFFYTVEDVYAVGSDLHLEWQRYYNSLAPETLTPDYQMHSNTPYLFGQMGSQWRHRYQYELDIRYAPLGEVWMILPDGSRHIFSAADTVNAANPVFRSGTLLSWEVRREGGITARWTARNGDGELYEFDRAGRLQHISLGQSVLLFSPAPRELVTQHEQHHGFFVTERYGRRIEVYADADNLIRLVRQQYELRYDYDGVAHLTRIQYPSVLQNLPEDAPNYLYGDQGLLAEIRDRRSPYHPEMAVTYTLNRQVASWTINLDERGGIPAIRTDMVYSAGQTTATLVSDVQQQITRSLYDTEKRITEFTLTDGTISRTRAFAYDAQSSRVYQYRQENGSRYSLIYDERGYLTKLSTPSTFDYLFTYRVGGDGVSRWLTSVEYPNLPSLQNQTTEMLISYTEATNQIVAISQPFERERSLSTAYEYDELGRVLRVIEPNPASESNPRVTEYQYDTYGYPNRVQIYDAAQPDIKYTLLLTFDISGRLIEIVDWRGQPVAIQWDNERNLIRSIRYGATEGLVNLTQYQYDEYSNLIERTAQELTETFTYNGLNLLASSIDGMGRVTNYRYDIFGNLVEKIVPADVAADGTAGKVFQYRYNGVNELVEYVLPNLERYLYTYQNAGTGVPTAMTVQAPNGDAVAYTYNVENLLTQVTQYDVSGNVSYSYRLEYDPQGNMVTLQEAHGGGRTLQLTYNGAHLPMTSRVGSIETQYTYNHASLLTAISNADATTTQYQYDIRGNLSQAILPDNDNSAATPAPIYQYLYDEAGNLTSFTDALGNAHTYLYDDLNRIVSVSDPLDNTTSYQYDARDNIISVTYPNGNVIRAEYNNANLMTRWIDAAGDAIVYEYDQSNRLRRITDRNNVVSNLTYDVLGNLVAHSATTSRETLYSYDNANRLISATNALGQTLVYNYNNLNRISQILDSLGNIELYRWTGAGRLDLYTNQAGQRYEYIADSIGRLQQINSPAQIDKFVMTYSDTGLIETVRHDIENLSDSYSYSYYPNGLLATLQAPEMDGSWSFEYDAMQQMTRVLSPEADEIRYTYDAMGRVTQAGYADGSSEQWVYDSVGNISEYTAPNGTISRFQYDAKNRVSTRHDEADGLVRVFGYQYSNIAPQVVIIDPNNHQTRYYYDEFGNITRVEQAATGANGEQALSYSYEYDRVNNLTAIRYPAIDASGTQPTQRFSYNALNQLTRYIDAAGGSWAYGYDPLGNLILVNDPLGNIINYEYDSTNRISTIRYNNGAYAEFRYNVRANTLSAPENRTRNQENRTPILYGFDFLGRLINIEHTANSRITLERDDLGRVESMQTANGATLSFDYNQRGQITNINTPEGNITREYDSNGYLLNSSGSGQNFDFTYDNFGYLTEFEQPNLRLTYGRDVLGNLLSVDNSLSGQTTYTYDNFYRLTQIAHPAETVTLTRNDAAWVTQRNYQSGLTSNYTYTADGRIANALYVFGSNRIVFTYEYDINGNLIRATRSNIQGAQFITRDTIYTYGRNNELIGERWLNDNNEVVYAVTYAYDLAGNRTQSVTYTSNSNPIRTVYLYNQYNQLTEELRDVPADLFDRYTANVANTDAARQAQARVQYAYDVAGNLTTFTHAQGSLTYRYDVWNRLIGVRGQAEDGTTVDVAILYDVMGRVQGMDISGIRYSMLYDQQHLQAIRNENEGTVETYHYSPDGTLLWRETPDGKQYPIIDSLGNLRVWLDESGQSVDATRGISMNGFGEIISPDGDASGQARANTPQLLYGGQIYEPSSQLYLLGVRAYSPRLGRFIQRDPVRHDPQSSLYTYVQNRPTYAVDLSGMVSEIGFLEAQAILYPVHNLPDTIEELVPQANNRYQRVTQAQTLEDARLLAVAYGVRSHFNRAAFQFDSAMCVTAFSGMEYSPIPFNWLPTLRLAENSNAWIADNLPDPTATISRGTIFDSINHYTRIAFNNLHLFYEPSCITGIAQPDLAFAPSLADSAQHTELLGNLAETPMYAAFGTESEILFDGYRSLPQTPNVTVEPQLSSLPLPLLMPQRLYNMQMDSYQLMQQVLLPFYALSGLPFDSSPSPLAGFSFEPYIENQRQ